MCGIFGEFIFKDNFNLERYLNRLNTLGHRGPDGYGFEYGNFYHGSYSIYHNDRAINEDKMPSSVANYFFGHRRLSIIDLSENASQPMESRDKKCSIVFNGEIYNYIELKEELLKEGFKFNTDHSDTEVLLNAYLKWGAKCLDKLRGMFAFAILDRRNKTIFMARDRIGQKPLYYELSEESFAFSSELTPLVKFSDKPRRLNSDALCFYVVFGYVPYPFSIFEGINKLPPATYAIFDLRKKRIKFNQYWDVDFAENHHQSGKDFVNEVEGYLTDSVSLRLRADVPIGAFISGGIDSTLIVKKIKELSQQKIELFGADFPQTERSERKYIEKVASRYSQNLNLSYIDLPHVENIKDIINVLDEPFDGGSSIAVFKLFKEAQKKFKVILTGDGGDEMFAGYTRYAEFPSKHLIFKSLDKLYLPKAILSLMAGLGIKNRKLEKLNKLIKGDIVSNFILFYHDPELMRLVKSEYRTDFDRLILFEDIKSKIKRYNLSSVKALQYFELKTILPGRMLYKIDRFSMFYGVEVRSPFLDHELIQLAFTIPEKFNIKDKKIKLIPKNILEKDFSMEFVHRKKQGFGNPLSYWFQKSVPEKIFGILIDKGSEIFKYLDYNKLHEYFPQIKTGYRGIKEKNLWRMLVLGQYLENVKNIIKH